ncbi:hypothetical protein ACFY1P_08865 [Streptomyces sp. NPDC001407]|uniref:hypothetical protein n=1 Tax=unclassified Streptomyces TaxID=2593676 RepID=UPI0033FBC66C
MPSASSSGPARVDAADLNEAIRAFLVARRGRALSREERVVYEELRARWVAATRRDRYGTAA